MRKHKWYPLCYVFSALAVAGFGLKVAWDWHIYTATLNSAPFRLFIMMDAVCFLLPAVLLLILGRYLRKKGG